MRRNQSDVVPVGDQELLQAAKEARKHAYVPYSRFPVGAAVLMDDGTVFTGCNVENASYGLANCAERTAIFKAVSEGRRRIVALAVIADTEGPVSPCGACRQVLREFGPRARVILGNMQGDIQITTAEALLPGAFDHSDLTAGE